MAVIAYDRPVQDFIAQLDATGHVSHVAHRKTKVTLHHNGARLSHAGVLGVWQVRPASAHFNFDAVGSCAQFVRINEYAWATGSTDGNQDSISFEMCNETLGPDWRVTEATWRAAARLAGWVFARVIGTRPSRENLVMHSYWSATLCAGPYISHMYEHILWFAQQAYDAFIQGESPDEPDTKRSSDVIVVKGPVGDLWAVGAEGRRHIKTMKEANAFLDSGAVQISMTETELKGIPVVGQLVWNYEVPTTPGENPLVYKEAHQVLADINVGVVNP